MAVAASALIEPSGTLTTSLFPGEDANALSARVAAYLAAATTDARVQAIVGAGGSSDAASTAYAYWRAYRAVVQRMNTEPLNVRLNDPDKGGSSYVMGQLAAMQALVDSYDQQLNDLLPLPADAAIPGGSTSIPNVFGW